MAELHFLRPIWFFALLPLIALIVYLRKRKKPPSAWKNEVDGHLLDHILVSIAQPQLKTPWYQAWVFVTFFWTVSVIALAGPSWDKTPPLQIIPDIAPLAVVLNLSRSMQSRDVYPDRLKQAQYKIRTLLDRMSNRPVALLVFSAQAHSVMPLTRDSRLISHLLEYMSPDLMPANGSNSSAGLQLAADILGQNNSREGQILLVTDSINVQAVKTIKHLASLDLQVLVYALAAENNGLKQLAEKGPGYYQIVTGDNKDISNLVSQLDSSHLSYRGHSLLHKSKTEPQTIQVWRDRGGWFIILLLPVALLMFRSGLISVLLPGFVCAVLFFNPVPAQANGWHSLWYSFWQNSNERGSIALDNNDPEQAEQLFSDPFLRGIAQYRQKKFTLAVKNFSSVKSAQGFYNKGNALVHLKRYKEAMAAYNTALQMNRSLTEASYNLQLVEKFRLQNQTSDKAEKNLLNRSKKNINEQPAKLLASLENKALEKQANSQQQEKKSANNTNKASRMSADIKNAMKPSFAQQENAQAENGIKQVITKNEQSTQTNSQKKQARQKHQAAQKQQNHSQTEAKKPLPGSESSSLPAKPVTDSSPDPDKSKPKATHSQVKNVTKKKQKIQSREGKPSADKNNPSTAEEIKNSGVDEHQQFSDRTQLSTEHNKTPELSRLRNEQFQSLEHWLDSIQDDPGGLLKEKFKREYKRATVHSAREQPGNE